MPNRLTSGLVTASLLVSAAAHAAITVTDYDAFASSNVRVTAPTFMSPTMKNLVGRGRVSSTEPRLGVPTFFWAERVAQATDLKSAGVTAEQAARRYLYSYATLYRTAPSALAEAKLAEVHDTGVGAVIATFERRVNGLPVYRDRLHVVMDQRLQLVALTGYLTPAPATSTEFKLADATAIGLAIEGVTNASFDSGRLVKSGTDELGNALFTAPTLETLHLGVARAKKVFYPDVKGLVPAWFVEAEVGEFNSNSSTMFATVIAANDGRVLSRHDLTQADSYNYRVWADPTTKLPLDGPSGRPATPHPTGMADAGYNPPFLAPSLVTIAHGPITTGDDWLPGGVSESTGNNVEAYADLSSPDGFGTGDFRGAPSTAGNFDYTYNLTAQPQSAAQRSASITQLFYNINWLHDFYYDKGFNEAAGNAQANNFGRGGLSADSIKAEAQDYSGTNNANMSTPSDGLRPRMQMYVFTGSTTASLTSTPVGTVATVGTAAFGSLNFNTTASAIIAESGGPTVNDGCTDITNNVTGKIAIIMRGSCPFVLKAHNAQAAGAAGVVIANDASHMSDPRGPGMSGVDDTITIGTLSVTYADGQSLITAVHNGPTSINIKRATQVDRDGAIDNTIVAHEWGHYLSNRLVADAQGLGTHLARGMGEGWADFTAMTMTVEASDSSVGTNANFGGVYALAVYASYAFVGVDASFYGIRRYPYSIDMTKNPLTFKHIADSATLPADVPFSDNGAPNSEVHNTGEVWAEMLWECYAGLLRSTSRLTFTQAQDRMQRYLVSSLKMTPVFPTMTEARDAVLAAAAAQDLADFTVFATAFAKRGMGTHAVGPDRFSQDNETVTEDYTLTAEAKVASVTVDDTDTSCDHDGVLDVGEKGNVTVVVKNIGSSTLSNTALTFTSPIAGVTFTPSTVNVPTFAPFTTATVSVKVAITGVTTPTDLIVHTALNDASFMPAGPREADFHFASNYDNAPMSSASDNFNEDSPAWTMSHDTSFDPFDWERVLLDPTDPFGHDMFGVDPSSTGDLYLVSPTLNVGTGPFSFTFKSLYWLEADAQYNWDGAVIELSQDNGATWVDIGDKATPGYTGTVTSFFPDGTQGNNPLLGRMAFVGQIASWPNFTDVTVNLGTTYASKVVKIRLRVAGDQATGTYGWEVDDFVFTGLTNTPFTSVVADRRSCQPANHVPVANAGPDFNADELSMVTLNSSLSSDADGDPLTATWTQTGGPKVTLNGAVFTAPAVTADTALEFALTVSDGKDTSPVDKVIVTIRNVNHAPVANAGPDFSVLTGTAGTLDPSGSSDVDGDTLTYKWTQTAGTAVTLTGNGFTAPAGPATLKFSLVVNDGKLDSAADEVVVTITTSNGAPVANAGPDFAVNERTDVTLDASASTDPDNNRLTATWTQTGGSPTVTLTDGRFTAPDVKADTQLTFSLKVNDGQVDSANTDEVVVTVKNVNRAPTVNAGVDTSGNEMTEITLTGTASDPDQDPIVSYKWTQTKGTKATLNDPTTPAITFTLPDVMSDETLVFQLEASDGTASGTDTVNVVVRQLNRAPTVTINAPTTAKIGDKITLEAKATDADGDTVVYAWHQKSGAPVKLSTLTQVKPTFTVPEAAAGSKLVFEVIVSDKFTSSAPASATITVSGSGGVNQAPTAIAGSNITLPSGGSAQLDGSKSSDPEGGALTYSWVQDGDGPHATLTGADTATPTLTVPKVTSDQNITIRLTVTDPQGATGTSSIFVTVKSGGGCGCTSAGGSEAVFFGLLAVGFVMARRRRLV